MKTGGRVGVVAFVGPTDFQAGIWIGVILERPEGKNNGTVDGRVYFKCQDKFGVFCRPNNLVKLNNQSTIQSPLAQRSQQHRRVPSPTNSIASSFAPSIAASQVGGLRDHSPFAQEYGYDIGDRVNTNDGRCGKIKFLNTINGQVYAGILLDKPVGNSSGEFNTIQYFKCYPKYAVFLPADQVKRATRTESALPPKIAPKQTTASKLRLERRGGLDGYTNAGASSWRGSMESLDSAISPRSPKSPPPKYGGTMKQSSFSKDNEVIAGLKKCLQEKEAHLTKLSNEMEERRCDSERLAQENKSLKLRIGELDFNLQELSRERSELRSSIAANEKKLEDLSFCYTESEVQRGELEHKLNELKNMPTLFEREEGMYLDIENSRGPSISALIDSQLLLPLDDFNKDDEKTFVEVDVQTENEQQISNKDNQHFGTQTENIFDCKDFGMQVNCVDDILEKGSKNGVIEEHLTKIFEEIGVQTEEQQIIKEKKKLFENNFTQTEEKKMIISENQTDEKLEKDSANQTDGKLLKDSANQTDKKSLQDSAFQTEEEVSKIFKQNYVDSIAQTLASTILNKEESVQTLPVLPPKIQSISSQTEELKQIPAFVHFIESAVQTDFVLPSPVDSFEANTLNSSTCKTNATPPRNSSFSSTNEVLELNVTQLPFNDIFSTPASSDDKQQLCSPNTLHKKLREKCQDVDRLEQQNSFLNKIIADQQMAIEQMKKMNHTNKQQQPQRRCRLYCEYCERFDCHPTDECPIEEARRQEKLAHMLNISGSAIVPGDIYADLEANNFIKNPLFGQGDKIYGWVGQQDWIYERTILLPQEVYKECPPEAYNGQCHVNFLRSMQASFAWDWGPSMPFVGIWRPIEIIYFDHISIENFSPLIEPLDEIGLTKCLNFRPSNYGKCPKIKLENLDILVPRKKIKLWWPNGYGSQPLYTLQLKIYLNDTLLDSIKKRIAFRSIYLNQSFVSELEHDKGRFFQFEVNNIPIFLKGTNFVPISIFPSRNNTLRRDFLFHSMIEANMNVLRVWGGGFYEADDFYSLADELAFLNSVKREVKEQVLRLRHHPSLLCWAGNNENELAISAGWYFAKNYSKELQSKDYLILYKQTIQPIVEKIDTSRPFLLSSPSNGIETEIQGGISENPGSSLYGDIHFYVETKNLWEDSTYLIPRCATEFGVQSMPFKSTMVNWIKEEDWKYTSETLLERQHHPGGALTLPMMILQHFLISSNSSTSFIDEFAFLSQVHQAIALQTQIEHYRRWRSDLNLTNGLGYTMCAMYWQLNDVWSAPTWSTIDFNLRWKIGHYFVKRSFAPLILSMYFDQNENFHLFVCSDLLENIYNSTITIKVFVLQYGNDPIYQQSLKLNKISLLSSNEIYLPEEVNWKIKNNVSLGINPEGHIRIFGWIKKDLSR
uniref:beta-mannosidase n=1 Tax=Meloidogyne javanica TaxID=6303 RepID=A0A915LXY0_MELJA